MEPPPGALLPGEEPVELPSTAGGIKQQAVGVGVEGHMVGRLHSPSMHANRGVYVCGVDAMCVGWMLWMG